MRRLLTALLLCAAPLAFGQAGWVQPSPAGTTKTAFGITFDIPLSGAQITVCGYPASGNTSTTPCSNKANVCTDYTGATCNTLNNPFSADSQGNFGFWILPGLYTYSVCTVSPASCSTYNVEAVAPGAVSSVFGRIGAVVAQSGDYTAAQIGLGNVTNDTQTKAAVMPNTAPSSGQIPVGNAGGTAYAPQTVSGDATLASAGAMTLATVNFTTGTCGDSTHVCQHTTNGKGLVTSQSAVAITGGSAVPEMVFSFVPFGTGFAGNNSVCTTSNGTCNVTIFPSAHTLVRLTAVLITAPSGCSTNAVVGLRDITASSNVSTLTLNQGSAQFIDSGALSVAMTAGHTFALGLLTASSGCGSNPLFVSLDAVLQ